MLRWMLIILCGVLLALPAVALVVRNGQTVTIPAGEVINDDLVVTAGTLSMQGRVTGDLVVAAGTVDISGPVGGNVMVAAGNCVISAPVRGSLYAAAGTLVTGAGVGRNMAVAAGTLTANSGAKVAKDLAVSAGTATISGAIGRNLLANAGTLTLTDGATVAGNLAGQAGSTTIATGAVIGGERNIARAEHERKAPVAWGAGIVLWRLLSGIALLLTGLLFVSIAPRWTEQAETMVRTHPWGSLLAGLVLLIVIPIAALFVMVTIIGIPLALITLAAYFSLMFLSPIILAIFTGRLILHRTGSLFGALALGVLIYFAIRLVPVLGGVVGFIAVLIGLGALALAAQARTGRPLLPAGAPPVT